MAIKYLGSKKRQLSYITEVVDSLNLPQGALVGDLFTGTTRVSQDLRSLGYSLVSNDVMTYSYYAAKAYIEGSWASYRVMTDLIHDFNELDPIDGYFTETFCRKSRYLQPKNGMKVDAVREYLKTVDDLDVKALGITILIEAADRVDSTVGLQMAYLKKWSVRSFNDIEFRPLDIPDGVPGVALHGDVFNACSAYDYDLVYYDPPFNQHSYAGNYHLWETLARLDEPEVYGVACKRVDTKENKSVFNSKVHAPEAIAKLIEKTTAKHIIFSYSNESYLSLEALVGLLEGRGKVDVVAFDSKRHVGHQIGVYSPQGTKVGDSGPRENVEYVISVECL